MHDALWWTGVLSRMDSCLTSSVPGTGSGSATMLGEDKALTEDKWMNKCYSVTVHSSGENIQTPFSARERRQTSQTAVCQPVWGNWCWMSGVAENCDWRIGVSFFSLSLSFFLLLLNLSEPCKQSVTVRQSSPICFYLGRLLRSHHYNSNLASHPKILRNNQMSCV